VKRNVATIEISLLSSVHPLMFSTKGTNTKILSELHVSMRKFNLQAKIFALDHTSNL